MKTLKIWIIILLITMALPAYVLPLNDSEAFDAKLKMRMYEGFRKPEQDQKTKVSTYFLDPYFQEDKNYLEQFEEEKGKLKKVFNLSEIHLETEANWYWPAKMPKRLKLRFQLKRQHFDILISKEKDNRFQITVTELNKSVSENTNLLETEIKLAENNTIIIGFEDSKERVFFLSFHRLQNHPTRERLRRKIVAQSEPSYPLKALAQNIEGNVILEGKISKKGAIIDLKVWQGHPLLVSSAQSAASQMEFSENGSKKTSIILIFKYYIEDNGQLKKPSYHKEVLEKFKQTEVWKKLDSKRQQESDTIWFLKIILIKGDK